MTEIKRLIKAETDLRDGWDPAFVARRYGLGVAEVEELRHRILAQKMPLPVASNIHPDQSGLP